MALIKVLPFFTAGSDMLSCTEDFTTVHAGAIVPRNTVSMVIFIFIIWAVTATHTCHVGTLQMKQNRAYQNGNGTTNQTCFALHLQFKDWEITYQWFVETVARFLSSVNQIL